MKKSNFVALVLGTISIVLFSLGVCMALIPEWNAFRPGVIFGCIGLLFGFITLYIRRKMKHKEPIHITGKAVLTVIVDIVGALALGVGMCFSMVWGKMILGIVIFFLLWLPLHSICYTALYHGLLVFLNHSLWFISMCAYYGILTTMRFSAVLFERSYHKAPSVNTEQFVMKFFSVLLEYLSVTKNHTKHQLCGSICFHIDFTAIYAYFI